VAPGTFLLAEAIEDARDVVPLFGSAEAPQCHLAYNNTTMTALWAAMAENDGAIFDDALQASADKPAHGHWLNYARCHDDIIWNALDRFADTPRQKRWTRFYGGGESFADGLSFQANAGAAASICGMASSLCGVADDAFGLDRLKLVYSIVYALDGVPMIYMGDEIALANDTRFTATDPDVRWLHRPAMDWDIAAEAEAETTPQGEMYAHLRMLSELLMAVPGLAAAGPALPLAGRDGAVLAFARALPKGRFLCVANLSDENQTIRLLRPATDLFDGFRLAGATSIPPWQVLWLHEI
jgi:amylosucrase